MPGPYEYMDLKFTMGPRAYIDTKFALGPHGFLRSLRCFCTWVLPTTMNIIRYMGSLLTIIPSNHLLV